jgi:Flp pilus assembly protein TadG
MRATKRQRSTERGLRLPALPNGQCRFAAAQSTGAAGFMHRSDGTAAVEFAIVSTPFVALILAVVQVGLIIYASQSLQTAAAAASRLILTGQAQGQNMSQSQFNEAVCGGATLFTCSGLMVDVRTYRSFSGADTSMPTLTYSSTGSVTNTWQYNPGGPGDIVVLRLMYRWPVFLGPLGLNLSNIGGGYRLLMAVRAFKNEPYR